MRLVFVTDLHGVQEYAGPLIEREGTADLLLVGGDLTNFGRPREAARVLEPLRTHFPRVLGVPGNVDQPSVTGWLEQQGLALHGRGLLVEGVGLFGCGASNPTPFKTPFELGEAELARLLEQGHEAVRHSDLRIAVSHSPPRDTRTDRLFSGKHVGSTAVREILETHRIALCLCGHIHESVAEDRVAGALVVNPGPFSGGRYAKVEVQGRDLVVEIQRLDIARATRWRATARMVGSKLVGFAKHRARRGR